MVRVNNMRCNCGQRQPSGARVKFRCGRCGTRESNAAGQRSWTERAGNFGETKPRRIGLVDWTATRDDGMSRLPKKCNKTNRQSTATSQLNDLAQPGAERDGALLVALCAIAIPFLYLAEHAGKTVTLFAYDWASNKFYQSPATKQL